MNNELLVDIGSGVVALAFAVFAPVAAAADPYSSAVSAAGMQFDAMTAEAGTIPAARPEPPRHDAAVVRGAQGPRRTDVAPKPSTDPSIRDSDPLTVNGLWETLPGNVIAAPPHSE